MGIVFVRCTCIGSCTSWRRTTCSASTPTPRCPHGCMTAGENAIHSDAKAEKPTPNLRALQMSPKSCAHMPLFWQSQNEQVQRQDKGSHSGLARLSRMPHPGKRLCIIRACALIADCSNSGLLVPGAQVARSFGWCLDDLCETMSGSNGSSRACGIFLVTK